MQIKREYFEPETISPPKRIKSEHSENYQDMQTIKLEPATSNIKEENNIKLEPIYFADVNSISNTSHTPSQTIQLQSKPANIKPEPESRDEDNEN